MTGSFRATDATGSAPASTNGAGGRAGANGGGHRTIDVLNPATNEIAGSVELSRSADVVDAVERARAAQVSWAARSYHDRARVLRRFHDLLLERSAGMLDVIQSESGKARRDAMTEVATLASTLRYYIHHGSGYLRSRRARGAAPLVTSARVSYRPIGVVGFITPWNYPLLLGVGDAVVALLAGNAVVIKPSETTPLSAVAARELLVEAGVDPDLVQLVHGPGSSVGSELMRHVDYVSFTGSTRTGRIVAQSAAARLIPCSLELGGKNPMIVTKDAKLEDAVWGLLNGAFPNSGQTCISVERAYIEDSVFDQFTDMLVRRVKHLELGWSTGWDLDMGSLISAEHAEHVEHMVEDAVAAGARVLTGGSRRLDLGEAYFAPTVLVDVPDDVALCREEVFGPVVALQRVSDVAEAIARANDTEYGLNASVWAGSSAQGSAIAERISAGSVGVNSTLLIYASHDVPMGGVKASGIGRRHAAAGIQRFTQAHSIVTSTPRYGGYESIGRLITTPKRAQWLIRLLRAWSRVPGVR